jgi:hypothetical protein
LIVLLVTPRELVLAWAIDVLPLDAAAAPPPATGAATT